MECVATVTLDAAEATRHAQRGAEVWRAGDVNPLIAILCFLRSLVCEGAKRKHNQGTDVPRSPNSSTSSRTT